MPTIPAEDLTGFATSLLTAVGVTIDEAAVVAASLVGSNLRGHDSHGVMRLPQYIAFIEQGQYRHGVDLKVESETPAAVICDGQWGLGQVQAHRLLDLVVPKAREMGVAVATARNCGHIGRLGEYAERAAAKGLLLLATVNNGGAARRVAPPGGLEPRLSTNPFCAGVPTTDPEAPIIADFGTSVVAEGKVRDYYISRRPVPHGWLLDHRGQPTTDPSVLYEPPMGTILPLGGAQSYKGFGLGLILDIWAGGLSGGGCSQTSPPGVTGNHIFFLALDPTGLAGNEVLRGQAAALSEWIRATPSASGVDRIFLPGDPERATFRQRHTSGIPLNDSHWARLVDLAQRLGVQIPE
jgi:hydroxycarboxylate dehydrogenase B